MRSAIITLSVTASIVRRGLFTPAVKRNVRNTEIGYELYETGRVVASP